MSIDPRVVTSIGESSGLAAALSDLNRRIRAMENTSGSVAVGAINSTPGPNSITGSMIQAGAIQTGHITAGAITAGLIAANAITAGAIAANAVTAGTIAANAVTAGTIAANAVTSATIAADAVTAVKIAADAVTATKITADVAFINKVVSGMSQTGTLTVTSGLSAISGNLGAITAGTITGGTIQTATSGARVVMDSAGLRGYALDGTTKVFEINAGSGVASFTGVATLDATSVVPGGTISTPISPAVVPAIGGGNRLPNSSAESGVGDWGTTGSLGSLTTSTTAYHGSKAAQVTATAAAGQAGVFPFRAAVQPGEKYVGSAYCRTQSGTARSVRVDLVWYTAADAYITQVGGTTVATTTTGWARSTCSATAPSNAAYCRVIAYFQNFASGEVFLADAFQLEAGELVTSYAPLVGEILPGTVTDTMIATLSASKLSGTLTDSQIAGLSAAKLTGQITGTQITDGAISTPKIATGAVTAGTIAAGAVTTEKLTVATLGTELVMNGGFEEVSASDATLPAKWVRNAVWGGTSTTAASTGLRHSGGAGLYLKGSTSASADMRSDFFPVAPGETLAVTFWANNGSGGNTNMYVRLRGGATQTLAGEAYMGIEGLNVPSPGNWIPYTAQVTIPSSWNWASIIFLNYQGATADLYIDDVSVRRVTVSAQIADGAITTAKITANAITAGLIATDAVTANAIQAGAITTAKMTANTINGDRITSNTLDATKITANTITATQIATGSLTANLIQAGAITADKISVGSPSASILRNGAFNEGNPPDGTTVSNGWTADGVATVQSEASWGRVVYVGGSSLIRQDVSLPSGLHIIRAWVRTAALSGGVATIVPSFVTGSGTVVSSAQVSATTGWQLLEASVTVTSAGTVRIALYNGYTGPSSGTAVYANVSLDVAVTNTVLAPDSVTTDKIVSRSILATDIATGTLTATEIATNSITADRLTVSQLSAIAADIGNITAGNISGVTVTGSTIQTSAGGNINRVVMDSTGIRAYGSLLSPPSPTAVAYFHSSGAIPAGTTYYYKVTATTPTGETTASSEVSATTTSGNLSIRIYFTPVPGATQYRIYRGTSPGAENQAAWVNPNADLTIPQFIVDVGSFAYCGYTATGAPLSTFYAVGSNGWVSLSPPSTNTATDMQLEVNTTETRLVGASIQSRPNDALGNVKLNKGGLVAYKPDGTIAARMAPTAGLVIPTITDLPVIVPSDNIPPGAEYNVLTGGVVWRFRLRSTTDVGSVFDCIGGTPIESNSQVQSGYASGSVWQAPGNAITAPWKGTYLLHMQGETWAPGVGNGTRVRIAPGVGSVVTPYESGLQMWRPTFEIIASYWHGMVTTTADNQNINFLIWDDGPSGFTSQSRYRKMSLIPVQVTK